MFLLIQRMTGTDPALHLHPRCSELPGAYLDELASAPSDY